ncbi:class I SAM-dependent methyltransferase [Nocardia aobensis]|uniref:class I SAM-dependent methyltransferase n=1 Tax=Nocardia aobensis TaxID=257277 RepID=UPI0012F67CF8|nr:methyltransferase domain-containing protein [Nocardia aobensis]
MHLGQLLHRQPNPDTPGLTMDHGHSYDLFNAIFFGGRRDLVYDRLATLSRARAGDNVLDVGCGTGQLTRRLAELTGQHGTVRGIDASGSMLEVARRATQLPNCSYAVGIAESLDVEDNSLDIVTSCMMLHHLPLVLRGAALAEMYRVLRPGGHVMVADFRPPTNPIGRRLVGILTAHAMEHNAIEQLGRSVRAAGFSQLAEGDLHPWTHYVVAVKPASAA